MSLLTATALTFAAAAVEGYSVLDHCRNKNEDEDEGTIRTTQLSPSSLIAHSVAYGVLSIPLSAIGASPSLELLSKLTKTHPAILKSSNDEAIERAKIQTKMSVEDEGTKKRRLKVGHGSASTDTGDKEAHLSSNSENNIEMALEDQRQNLSVQRVREENRRSLAAMREKRLLKEIVKAGTAAVARPTNGLVSQIIDDTIKRNQDKKKGTLQWSRVRSYIATLDGRVLPTQMAEAMRRIRILIFGYGLVSTAVAYQISCLKKETKEKETTQSNYYKIGRDKVAVEKFADTCTEKAEEGIALRLFLHDDQNEFKHLDKNNVHQFFGGQINSCQGCVLPIVTSKNISSDGNIPVHGKKSTLHECTGSEVLYWHLGQAEHEWYQLPINSKWLFSRKVDGAPNNYILVESNISGSIRDCAQGCSTKKHLRIFQESSSNDNHGNDNEEERFQKLRLEASKIQRVATNKLRNDADDGQAMDIMHVFIGNDIDVTKKNYENVIIMNGLDGVTFCILAQVQEILSSKLNVEHAPEYNSDQNINSTSSLNAKVNKEITSTTPYFISTVDFIGKRIRQLGQSTVTHVGGVFHSKGNIEVTNTAPLISTIDFIGKQIRQLGQLSANHIGRIFSSIPNKKNINIFTDDPYITKWLESRLKQTGMQVNVCDIRSTSTRNIRQKVDSLASEDIFLFLCSSDAATINIATEVMACRKDIDQSKFISVVEKVASKETLMALTKSSVNKRQHIPLCVATIHEGLFTLARSFLREGKNPVDTQRVLNERLKI